MKIRRIILFFVAAFCIQPTVMFLYSIKNCAPNSLLCVTILLVVTEKENKAIIGFAVLTAALQELCFSAYPGPASAAIFLAAATAAVAGRIFTTDSLFFLCALTALETVIYNLSVWAGGKILGAPYHFFYVLSLQPLYILCNLALMLMLYFLFIKKYEGGYRV